MKWKHRRKKNIVDVPEAILKEQYKLNNTYRICSECEKRKNLKSFRYRIKRRVNSGNGKFIKKKEMVDNTVCNDCSGKACFCPKCKKWKDRLVNGLCERCHTKKINRLEGLKKYREEQSKKKKEKEVKKPIGFVIRKKNI